MRKATELSLFLENKPGALAELCRDFKKRKVNIEAITIVDHTDHALVRMIVSDKQKGIEAIEDRGLLVLTADVLRIELSHRPGALAEISEKLARAKINIQYLYGSVGISTRANLFLRVSDIARAKKVLER